MKHNEHYSVQKDNAINNLNIKSDGIYVDCTFGRGGHSLEILKLLNKNGKLISIDRDKDAYEYYLNTFPKYENHIFVNDKFSNLDKILKDLNIDKVDGFLYDFGVSSPQLDNKDRGFSYKLDARLDMRMNQDDKLDALFIVNNYSKSELNNIFRKYGEISNPTYVVNAIIDERQKKSINTTLELCEIIKNNVHKKELYQPKHYARKYFQAIRMEVNDELNEIKKSITSALEHLEHQGRIVTISFHSLEEKTIKECYNLKNTNFIPKEIPINNIKNEFKIINVKQKRATKEETEINHRSRSSLIKVIERN